MPPLNSVCLNLHILQDIFDIQVCDWLLGC
jgi:hypothetical protein